MTHAELDVELLFVLHALQRNSPSVTMHVSASPPVLARKEPDMPRKLYRLAEALDVLGIGKTKAYDEMAAGRLRYVQYGSRRLIPEDALDDFVAALIEDAA